MGFHRGWPAVATALLLGSGLGACSAGDGGDDGIASVVTGTRSSTASATAGAASEPDREEQALKYARCMREHGVDMPDPGPDGRVEIHATPGTDVDGAQEACREFLPAAPDGGTGPQLTEADKEAALAFARCMREHGVDMADPDFSGGGIGFRIGGEGGGAPSQAQEQAVEAAQQACGSLMPEPGGGGPGGRIGAGNP